MHPEAINGGGNDAVVAAPARFLFVNGDLSSKSLSKIEAPKLRPVINRHVQRWSFENRGRKKQASLPNTAKRRSGQKKEELASRTKVLDDGSLPKAKLEVVRPTALDPDIKRYEAATEEPKLKACIWSDGNYLDPFASTDMEVDGAVFKMLQYFTFTWKPFPCSCDVSTHLCMFPCEVDAANSKQQSAASISEIAQNCLQNKTHMYALLASCAGRMKYISQREVKGIAKPESYMAQAIQALREHLINKPEVDREVIRDIFFMYTCEYFSQNLDCAQSYLRILRSMVDRIGGFSGMDIYDRRLYWCGDIGLALETGCPPILPAFENSRIYHTSSSSDSSVPKIGSAFERRQNRPASVLDEIVSDMISCAQSVQCIIAAHLSVDRQRMFEHGADFLHRLLSLREPQDNCSLAERRGECLRHALLLWIFNVMIWPGAPAARTSQTNPRLARPLVAVRLRQAICHVDSLGRSGWASWHETLFWMLGVGSCVAGPGDDQSWFKDRFVHLAGVLQISNPEQIADVFREHFYLHAFEKPDLMWLEGLIVQQQHSQTKATPGQDMSTSSVMTPSDTSPPFSDTKRSSVTTLSTYSTPSSRGTP